MRSLMIALILVGILMVVFAASGLLLGAAGAAFTYAGVIPVGIPLMIFAGCLLAGAVFCLLAIPALFVFTLIWPPPAGT